LPVCLNCGKGITPGKQYCEQCGSTSQERTQRLMEASAHGRYKSPTEGYNRTLMIGMLGLAVVLVAVSVGIALSVPTGTAYTKKVQAAVCRANMRGIERAISNYYAANRNYPPAGRIDSAHPIITDQYLKSPPRCPGTHHYYEIVPDGSRVSVRCDSGLAEHRL
jgi:uncharacterized membrane protein YvbJ